MKTRLGLVHLLAVLVLPMLSVRGAENEIGWIEKFALAPDREAVLDQLVPRSDDYFFFHALHYQNTKQAAKLNETIEQWRKQAENNPRREIIENRQALLDYETDPQKTLNYLRDHLHLQFTHEQQARDQKPNLPAKLDPALITREKFESAALKGIGDLKYIDDEGLATILLDKVALTPAQTRDLLRRIKRPDMPGLVDLILAELNTKESRGFGEFPIHSALLPEQLDQLARAIPTLYRNHHFVATWLRKLAPSADADAEFDPTERAAWLQRVWAFAKNLDGSFNSLKAQILLQQLEMDRSRGVYDKARFQEYIKLPRRTSYSNVEFLRKAELASEAADLNANESEALGDLPLIHSDEVLVHDYLLHLLKDEPAWEPWAAWLRDTWLKPVFAEAKIVNGVGDPEKWASLLSPAAFQALKDRVDVDFSPANAAFLAPADEVSLDLLLKNTSKVIVKIYEINTLSYFLANKRPLNTDLALDGLVANREETHDFSADEAGRNPFRRTLRTFKFPELKGRRGAWVIEFIGGGKSSRALIRKGQFSLLAHTTPEGDSVTVLDEARQPVKDAALWLEGRKLVADEKTGAINVPFAQKAGMKPIVLADAAGTFATLANFNHRAENYRLDAQIHVEREQLLAERQATIAVRAALLLNDGQIPLDLLLEPKLTITSTTLDGVTTTQEVKIDRLDPAKVYTHTITVPERLANLAVAVRAQVERASAGGEKVDVSAQENFALNGIDKTSRMFAAHLSRFDGNYVVELLGKNGEPVADRQVLFEFTHRGFRRTIPVALRTDEHGRIDCGALPDIARVQVKAPGDEGPEQNVITWELRTSGRTWPQSIHAVAGEPINIPWTSDVAPEEISLLEERAGTFVADRSKAVTLGGGGAAGNPPGNLTFKGLEPGDYLLTIPGTCTITLRVTAGQPVQNWLLSPNRELEVRDALPLNIAQVRREPDALVVQLANVGKFARVHVAATRFLPETDLLAALGRFVRFNPGEGAPEKAPNLFSAGRTIGDEYRYILERRYAKLFPGNMLPRPGLLLNPWELRSTDLQTQHVEEMQRAMSTAGGRGARSEAMPAMAPPPPPSGSRGESDIDFLAQSAPVLYNLVADDQGVVRIDLKALGDRQYVQIYAEDLRGAAWRTLALAEVPTKFTDLRLVRNLDPQKPFAEKKETTVLTTGQTLTLADVLTADLETYDSLSGVFTLLNTLNHTPNLAKFAWITQWPKFKDEEKRAKYSEFASHELNFFLSRKDPAFFQKVVQPYLRNKKDRTFMDDYLLGNDLHRYLEPWAFARLNAAERCLLAQHLPGEAAAAARHERELWELIPPNPEQEDMLFETALRGRALTEASGGLLAADKAKEAANLNGQQVAAYNETRARRVADVDLAWSAPSRAPGAAAPAPAAPMPMKELVGGLDASGMGGGGAKGTLIRGNGQMLRDGAESTLSADDAKPRKAVESETVVAQKVAAWQDRNEDQLARGAALGLERVRQFFRELGPTKEWAENNYYQLPLAEQNAELIPANAFWRDYAAWDGKSPFISANVAEAGRSFTEVMLALAVLDLPFESPKHTTRSADGGFTLTAAGPLIAYHKEIKPAAPAAGQAPLLVSQNFFRADDRYRQEGNEKFDKYVTEEFLAGVVYGANVVVTNPTSAKQKVSVLLQIPREALPVNGSKATDSRRLEVGPYSTQTLEYYFYFPVPADQALPHYPVHVSREEQVVGEAKPFTFKVVRQLTQADKTSWDYVSQYGTDEEVFAFLDKANIERLDLERVAWRARKNAEFFQKIVGVMEQRHVYSEPVYRYSIVHNAAAPLATWLRNRPDFINRCGPYLDSKLIKIDPIERRIYEHLEYSPLVNQRVHRIGAENTIPNAVFREQYQHLLEILAHKPALEAADQMSLVYYLFLQDRIEEALARFHAIAPEALPTRLQHDYFRCYAAFYEEQPAVARGIAQQYADYPVDRWRKLFAEVSAQLDEIEGKQAVRPGDKEPNRDKQQGELAATEPTFDFKVENREVALTWKNLKEVTIRYYLMDPEFLFSASPFVTENSERFSIIKATRTDAQALPEGKDQLAIPLPPEFTKANVLVEILGAGQRKAQTYHANTLKLAIAENYGRLEARDATENKPVSKAYVKVYARLRNGTVRFFKDGYTDLRGRFDYASLNSSESPGGPVAASHSGGDAGDGMNYQMLSPSELKEVDRFAILLMSEAHGADVREAAPPSE